MAQNPGLPIPDVSKIIGEQWRGLSSEAKEEWNMLAEEEKARHQQQYPGYRYQPRRNGKVSNQPSISGPSAAEPQDPCSKCGGKPMSYYNNLSPLYTPPTSTEQQAMAIQVPAKRSYVVSNPPPQRMPPASPQHIGQQKAFVEAYPYQRVDPRLVYAVPTAQPLPTPPSSDTQDAKRRRFNSNGVYIPARESYHEAQYGYAQSPVHHSAYSRPEVVQVHPSQVPLQHVQPVAKPTIVSPPRAVYPRPPQLQPVRPPHPHQRTRSSIALPPIETMVSQTPIKSPSVHSQGSGVEAMIMSIPVLNKIKVLSQISAPLPPPGPLSPKPEVRGAIIAIEGMDPATVNSMMNSLAEQLEKEGKFAVRIFGGPVPAPFRTERDASDAPTRTMTTEMYLSMLSEWHQISKEMVEYISTRPGEIELGRHPRPSLSFSSHDTSQTNPRHLMEKREEHETPENGVHSLDGKANTAPNSVVFSPKTMDKAADLSIRSPSCKGRSQSIPGTGGSSIGPSPIKFPRPPISTRIPPAPATPPPATKPSSRIPPPPPSRTHQPTSVVSDPDRVPFPRLGGGSSNAIPIALVPHFQLTTVDASSITMPISDGFSPPAHWQWFATLWRGSIGPDITVVVKGVDDEIDAVEPTSRTSVGGGVANTPMAARERNSSSSAAGHSGVEIRLNDCRAVIVKTAIIGMSTRTRSASLATVGEENGAAGGSVVTQGENHTSGSMSGPASAAHQAKELENWEKAKRRVGFEVEEFLRR
ncbi:slightly ste11-like protein [Exophiala oligosperma]